MDSQLPQTQGAHTPDQPQQSGDRSPPCPGKAGRRQKERPPVPDLTEVLYQTIRHFFPELTKWLNDLPDFRDPDLITYDKKHLVWDVLMMYLTHLESCHQFFWERLSSAFRENLKRITGTNEETVAHPDTIKYYLKVLDPQHLNEILFKMIHRLMRMKALDDYRLRDHFLVAVDGSGQLFFRERHCPHCLVHTRKDGSKLYFHNVLVAMLVTGNGLALPMAVEFIENPSEEYDKQDCELRAFHRLAAKLKQAFPRTPLCLLLDALFAGQPVFDLCRQNSWKFFVTFKEGSMPELYAEAQQLLKLTPANQRTIQYQDKTQYFQWLDDLPYADHHLKLICCRETKNDETINFVWLTNFRVDYDSVAMLANGGGRLRWKVENEGFNVQKNGGFNMEHAYCEHPNANQNYFLLLQIAHFLFQLMVKGSLFVAFRQQLGTWKNFARRLAESFRNRLLPPDDLLNPVGQIRFSTA
jgi:hypothetical protein